LCLLLVVVLRLSCQCDEGEGCERGRAYPTGEDSRVNDNESEPLKVADP